MKKLLILLSIPLAFACRKGIDPNHCVECHTYIEHQILDTAYFIPFEESQPEILCGDDVVQYHNEDTIDYQLNGKTYKAIRSEGQQCEPI